MIAWLKRLFATAPAKAHAAEPIDYKGFAIIATPRAVGGGWSTEGVIRQHVGDETREVAFIRADTCMSEQDAVHTAQDKARKIIDERGATVFDGQRA